MHPKRSFECGWRELSLPTLECPHYVDLLSRGWIELSLPTLECIDECIQCTRPHSNASNTHTWMHHTPMHSMNASHSNASNTQTQMRALLHSLNASKCDAFIECIGVWCIHRMQESSLGHKFGVGEESSLHPHSNAHTKLIFSNVGKESSLAFAFIECKRAFLEIYLVWVKRALFTHTLECIRGRIQMLYERDPCSGWTTSVFVCVRVCVRAGLRR